MSKEITFIESDAKEIYEELISDFERAHGETLYPGDERRIFLQQMVPIIVGLKNDINDSARQNLLRYARDDKLDGLGKDFYDTERLQAQKASCSGKVKLSTQQNKDIMVPLGTRVTPDGILFFRIKEDVIIYPGEIEKECMLEAVEAGEQYNGFIAGQIKNIVDPTPFVETIVNTSISQGGSDIEDDERYRERCRLSPESLSVAGPDGAYEYWAKTADVNIVDVSTTSPSPGVVRIVPLLKDGGIPTQTTLDKIYETLSPRDRRPLTDKIEVSAPTVINYDISLTYYLDKNHKDNEMIFRKAIEGEKLDCSTGAIRDYINWQQERLGRSISPDELRYIIQNAATYKTFEGEIHTVVRKFEVTSPIYTEIKDEEVAKAGIVTIAYGGLI